MGFEVEVRASLMVGSKSICHGARDLLNEGGTEKMCNHAHSEDNWKASVQSTRIRNKYIC